MGIRNNRPIVQRIRGVNGLMRWVIKGRIPIFTVKLSTTNDVDKRIQHDDF